MNGVRGARSDCIPRPQLFNCTHADCGATFTRQWRLGEHETAHTGARPVRCAFEGCGRSFSRKSHMSRHVLQHSGVKQFKCTVVSCTKTFFHATNLRRHVRYSHGEKDEYFKCNHPNCSSTFRKRRAFKLHLMGHGEPAKFKCSKDSCAAMFESHAARKAHVKKHAGYRCPHGGCNVMEGTWGKLQKHMKKHPATFTCRACQKVFRKVESLRKHMRSHALHKPVLVCPKPGCQAYFSTTFNLQHHIRKVHLQLLKYSCSFPDCPSVFAMRESMTRHMQCHDPCPGPARKRQRSKRVWQRRLDGHHQLPLVEDDLRRLFALRMRVSRRAKVEANLAGLFNERKIPHYVDPEVNLCSLFSLRPPKVDAPPAVKC